LLTGLEHCSDASIFHHTFQTLGSHHFLTEVFRTTSPNGCFRTRTGTTSPNSLRRSTFATTFNRGAGSDLCRVVADYCATYPHFASQSALERFYFCESVEVTPLLAGAPKRWMNFAMGSRF